MDKTFLILKSAAGVLAFNMTADALARFEREDAEKLPSNVSATLVQKPADLESSALTTKDMLGLYNLAADRDERPKLSKFQDKPSAADRTFALLGLAADVYPPNVLALFADAAADKAADGSPKREDDAGPGTAASKPKRTPKPATEKTPRSTTFKDRAPKAKVHPCRAGTKQAALVDALAKGATLDQLRAAVGGVWNDSSIKSALYWDINSQKGYGVTASPNDAGELVFSLTFPKGMSEPLPHTPRKAKGA